MMFPARLPDIVRERRVSTGCFLLPTIALNRI